MRADESGTNWYTTHARLRPILIESFGDFSNSSLSISYLWLKWLIINAFKTRNRSFVSRKNQWTKHTWIRFTESLCEKHDSCQENWEKFWFSSRVRQNLKSTQSIRIKNLCLLIHSNHEVLVLSSHAGSLWFDPCCWSGKIWASTRVRILTTEICIVPF